MLRTGFLFHLGLAGSTLLFIGCTQPIASNAESEVQTGNPVVIAQGETSSGDQTFNSIAAGERVVVNDGKLIVNGNIGDGATLENNCPNGSVSVSGSGTSVTVNGNRVTVRGNGSVTINGQTYTGDNNVQLPSCGIEVYGTVGNNVTFDGDTSVKLFSTAGNGLDVIAGNRFEGESIGSNAEIQAGNSIEISSVGEGSALQAGNSVDAYLISGSSTVRAGNSIDVTCAFGGSYNAGNSIDIDHGNTGSLSTNAGNDVDVDSTDMSSCR